MPFVFDRAQRDLIPLALDPQVLNTPNTAVKIGIIGGTGERVRRL